MQNYWLSFFSTAPLFLVILGGVFFSKTKSFKKDWITVMNDYALWIGFPALILVALFKLNVPLTSHIGLVGWNSAYIVCCMLLAFPISKILGLSRTMLRTLILAISFGNVSYLGIPVLLNVYGEAVLAETTLLSAVYLFWLFTLGIIWVEVLGGEKLNGTTIIKRLATNPLLLAVIIGLTVSALQVEVHPILMKGLDLLGSSVTAIVLFSLGLFLGSHPFGKLKEWAPVLAFSVAILLLLPFLFKAIIEITDSRFHYRISIMEAAMPMGFTPYVLAVKYDLNAGFASKVVVLSTSLAVFTLPLWMVVLS